MKNFAKYILMMALVLPFAQQEAKALEAGGYSVGALLGLVFPSDKLETRVGYGARASYNVNDTYAIGLQFQNSAADVGIVNVGLMNIHADFLYFWENLYAGAKLGTTRTSGAVLGQSGSTWDLSAGPMVGYDFNVANNITVGPSAEYIFVFADNNYQLFNIFANVKYHF